MLTPRPDNVTSRRKVLMTGGSGFVGANLARRLIADGHDVHLLLAPGRPRWRLDGMSGQYTAHSLDLHDDDGVRRLIAGLRPEWVFHLATYGAYPSQDQLDRALATNVVATVGLVTAALDVGFESFVVAGTSSEYGHKDHPPDESEGLNPTSHYAATKAAATILCREIAAASGTNLVILRPYSVYGPFEEPTRLIPALIAGSWDNRLPPLVNPDTAHDFVFIDDVVDAFIRCAAFADHVPGAIYNVSSGTQLSLREVVVAARDVLGVTALPDWDSMEPRPWDTAKWQGTSLLLFERTGWLANYTFSEGLRMTADWFDANARMKAHYTAARGLSAG